MHVLHNITITSDVAFFAGKCATWQNRPGRSFPTACRAQGEFNIAVCGVMPCCAVAQRRWLTSALKRNCRCCALGLLSDTKHFETMEVSQSQPPKWSRQRIKQDSISTIARLRRFYETCRPRSSPTPTDFDDVHRDNYITQAGQAGFSLGARRRTI